MNKLLGQKSLRVLSFVQTLNEQGIKPSLSDTNAFAEAATVNDYDPYPEGYFRPTVYYLLDARLLNQRGTSKALTVTEIGAVLLKAEDASSSSEPVEIVGRLEDPFTYAKLLTRIDHVEDALVIDPYLSPDNLLTLLKLSSNLRFLTLDKNAAGLRGRSARID